MPKAKKRKKSKPKAHKKSGKGHVPLDILEKRARRLVRLVASRGGSL